MQLSASLQRRVAGARIRARNVTAFGRVRPALVTARPRTVMLAGEQEETATAEASAEEAASPAAPPMERARAVLEAADLDRDELEAALSELEAEMAALREAAAAGEAEGARAAALEGSLATSKDQYLRLQADFDNFRRRTAKEKDELAARAKGDMVLGLLPLVDNFELARTQVKTETEGEAKIQASYQGLYKQMVDILKGLGVEPVATVGSPFDPNFHEAIAREANDDVPDGTVLQEFRKGFAMGERLLRPAMVQVSFTDKPADVAAAETQEDEPAEADAAAAGEQQQQQ